MMSPEEQLQCTEEGVYYPVEFEVMELLVGATALLKGLFKAGVKVFAKKASKEADDVYKTVINPATGKKEWPNSPYLDKTVDPKEMQETINQEVLKKIKDIDPHGIGKQNAEIQKIHKEFIETGQWPIKNKKLDDYHISLPDPALTRARQEYLKALSEHN